MTVQKYRPFIQPLINELTTRSKRAALSLMGIAQPSLRRHLSEQLSGQAGSRASMLADPVFEPTFGWTESDTDMAKLSGTLLHAELVACMANPPKPLADDYTFPITRSPFAHQIQAWQTLSMKDPRSLVVTSGTGSGKTECFLVPILDRLARQAEIEGALQGVRALFIYPLNALIASQQNRLDAWTDGFNGRLRYCLYTGNLPDEVKGTQKEYRGQVIDRRTLRSDPPPMLVTNATMLEYMLVRKEDAPILLKSQGKLEWIVLDEAHTHIGSQAAEMALLLRRVMLAFGVLPKNVRFVATSATFGDDDEATRKLKVFLAAMAGVEPNQIYVVHGKRHVPILPLSTVARQPPMSLESLGKIDSEDEVSAERFDALASHSVARAIRTTFSPDGKTRVYKLSSLVKQFESLELVQPELMRWLDLLSGTRRETNGQSYLPLRIHLFHNVLNGLYACVDPNCPEKPEILSGADWAFGNVYTSERLTCACCAPVLPVVSCRECNALHLQGMVTANHRLTAPQRDSGDEFALDADEVSDEAREENNEASPSLPLSSVLVSNRIFEGRCPQSLLDTSDHTLRTSPSDTPTITLHLRGQDGPEYCPACDSQGGNISIMRRLSFGSPLTMGLVTGTLLEFCPDDKDAPLSKPFRGRKMITFTDSRQGTARLALKLQQDSERNRVRGLIYHLLLQSAGAAENINSNDQMLLTVLQERETAATITPDQAAALERLKAKQLSTPSAELGWNELRAKLAGSNDIEAGMLDYYSGIAPNAFSTGAGASTLYVLCFISTGLLGK